MKENSKIVFNYIKEHNDENITAPDIAAGTGLETKSVNGIITSALIGTGKNKANKNYVERVPGEIEMRMVMFLIRLLSLSSLQRRVRSLQLNLSKLRSLQLLRLS